jgi:hypothetical protein
MILSTAADRLNGSASLSPTLLADNAGMDLARCLALALDPSLILRAQGLDPDPWQRDFLLCADRQVLLNCCRQSGKSTTTAARALHEALFRPRSLVLLLSPTQRQSAELFRKVRDAYDALGRPVRAVSDSPSASRLELANGSRVLGLPGDEATVRGFSRAALLLIDEAAKVPDGLYRAVRPMLAVSRGRIVCLSTPFGPRGFFYREWHADNVWRRFRVTWRDCPRIAPDFIEPSWARWARTGSIRSTTACSPRWRGWSTPTSRRALWIASRRVYPAGTSPAAHRR